VILDGEIEYWRYKIWWYLDMPKKPKDTFREYLRYEEGFWEKVVEELTHKLKKSMV
jgi:hypothetical protein